MILFPSGIPFFQHFQQMEVIRMMFIQPDAELAVNVIHMKTIGIFKIKKCVHQTIVCSVIYGRNCVGIDMQDGSHLCDQVILR